MRYVITHVVDVLEPVLVIAAGRMLETCWINSTQEALEAIYAPGVVPLDHGFETVSCNVREATNWEKPQ
jgi:hypothetical protein